MKKFACILTALALLTNSTVMAANTNGRGAAASTCACSDNGFAWGIALGALAVVGTAVGIIAASSSEDHSFSH